MSMTQIRSATAEVTDTYAKVLHVTRKVQADLLAILDLYEYFSEGDALNFITDVRSLLDEEILSHIHLVWTAKGTTRVIDEILYTVISGTTGVADEGAGKIGYQAALASAQFNLRVTYNARWLNMNDSQRQTILKSLILTWGAASPLDYSGGSYASQQTYSKDDLALARSRFVQK